VLARSPVPPEVIPESLRALVESPPLVSAWIPEVHAMAIGLAISDHHHRDDREFLEQAYALNRELLGSPTYRYLMVGDSPEAMLRHATVRWAAMHRGARLEVHDVTAHACVYRLAFPAHLFNELLLEAFGRTFQASFDLCGAAQSQVTLVAFGDATATFNAMW